MGATSRGAIEEWLSDPAATGVRALWHAVNAGSGPIFVTGPAGTGKATLLRLIADRLPNAPVLAPTGVAALRAGGQTLHSFFRLPPGILLPGDDGTNRPTELYRGISTLIIDEVSMVRADVIRAGLAEGTAYYTVPGVDGVPEHIEILRLRAEWPALQTDVRLRGLDACTLPAVLKGRALLLAADCAGVADRAASAAGGLDHEGWARELRGIAEEATACAVAARAVAERVELPGLPEAPAQTVGGFTPDQLSQLISPRYPLAADGLTPARLVPLLEHEIRRVPNPRYERRFAMDGEIAAEFLFDRVEALAYAAFRWGDRDERYYANLAATTLGRLRDPRFVAPVLGSDRFEERVIGVACSHCWEIPTTTSRPWLTGIPIPSCVRRPGGRWSTCLGRVRLSCDRRRAAPRRDRHGVERDRGNAPQGRTRSVGDAAGRPSTMVS